MARRSRPAPWTRSARRPDGLLHYLGGTRATSVAIAGDAGGFPHANAVAVAFAAAVRAAGIKVTAQEVVPAGSTDLGPLKENRQAIAPDVVLARTGCATGG